MPYIAVDESVPGIRALLAFRPETAAPLGALANALLHAPNSLSRGERELIAAYVSSLNACAFCYRSHAAIASCHLQDDALVDQAIADPEHAGIPDALIGRRQDDDAVWIGGEYREQAEEHPCGGAPVRRLEHDSPAPTIRRPRAHVLSLLIAHDDDSPLSRANRRQPPERLLEQ